MDKLRKNTRYEWFSDCYCVLNTKINEVENETLDVKKKTDYNAKISDNEKNYFTTSDYNKFTKEILTEKIKEKK